MRKMSFRQLGLMMKGIHWIEKRLFYALFFGQTEIAILCFIDLGLNSFLFVCACLVLPSFHIESYASSVSFLQILHFGWKFFMS